MNIPRAPSAPQFLLVMWIWAQGRADAGGLGPWQGLLLLGGHCRDWAAVQGTEGSLGGTAQGTVTL